MSLKISINGKLVDQANATISVFDHGLLYGDGVFEGMRCYSGKVFRLAEHLKRLYQSALSIGLTIPTDAETIAADVNKTLAANNMRDGYIRLVVTRGSGTLGLDPNRCSNPQIIIIADHISLYPEQFYLEGMEIITAATMRNHPAALSPRIKSLNYLNNILAKMEGLRAGCVEALMLNHKGEVAECTGDNIFIVRDGILMTPPIDAGILEGITRNAVLDLAAAESIPSRECTLLRHDIFIADECFLTGSAAEVIPVTKLDDRVIGSGKPGPVTLRLRDAFKKLVHAG
jgi:branched-chain amino acid aminotransferase